MRRFYIRPDGTERTPTGDERSHYGIAATELAKLGLPQGDAEDSYVQMWRLGYARAAELDDGRLYVEKYGSELTAAQRRYLADRQAEGTTVILNDRQFESTRKGQPDEDYHQLTQSQAALLVSKLTGF